MAAGCQARSTVEIDVGSNGSGSVEVVVELDAQAVAAIPNLAEQLRTSDLERAGWDVDGPELNEKSGMTVIRVSHGFHNAGEANGLLKQLGSRDGPFRDFRIEIDRSFSQTDVTFDGTVDLTQGIASFGDDVLRDRVGLPLGFDADEMSRSLGTDWATTFPVDIVVDLPGDTSRSPSTDPDSNGRWHASYDAATALHAESSARNVLPLALSGSGVACLFAAALVATLWKSDVYKPQHRRHWYDRFRRR